MALDLPVLATILLLVPLFYLLIAAPAFLLVSLAIPQVAHILRAVMSGYFRVLIGAGLAALLLMAVEGRAGPVGVIAVLLMADVVWRRWLMPRLDALVVEVQAGVAGVGARLRRLHWLGMAVNAAQLGVTLPLIPWAAAAG